MITTETLHIHFHIIGILLIALSMIHIIFPKYFNWKVELKELSLINRQMMKTHTFFIALIVLMMGILCLYSTDDLIHTELGKIISLGFGLFWSIRLYVQFFGYSSQLWKGKAFETIVHIVFSHMWLYLSFIFILNYMEPL